MTTVNGVQAGKDLKQLRDILRDSSLAYVHHVDPIARMYTAYVGAHVRRMFRPVDAVGTIVPRRLTALDPPVILKIVLHAEHAVAIAAGKRSRVSIARLPSDDRLVRDRPIIVFPPFARRPRLGGCKKAQNVFVIQKARNDHR